MKKYSPRMTLKDIAAKTGYSTNTVSRALRNMPDISADTRTIIHEVSRSLGYFNNTVASSLRLGRTRTLAVIIPDISNPFFAFAMIEIERAAREKGYTTILLNTSELGQYEYRAIQTALQKNVDGIIFSPAQNSTDNIIRLIDAGVPFVLFGRFFEDFDTDYVIDDNEMGGFQAADYLIKNGHKNIMMLNGFTPHNSAAKGRLQGYLNAFEANGLPVQKDLILETSAKGDTCVRVFEATLNRRKDITAVFCFSDLIAWSVIHSLDRQGRSVPEDISVVGFDNMQSHLSIPLYLTSVDNHVTEMASAALDVLIQKLNNTNKNEVICRKIHPTTLIAGRTVRDITQP